MAAPIEPPKLRGKKIDFRSLALGSPLKLAKEPPKVSYNYSDEVYQIERIITQRFNKKTGHKEFLTKWCGFSIALSTWEPLHEPVVREFYHSKPGQKDLEFCADILERHVQAKLLSNTNVFNIELRLDLFRGLFGCDMSVIINSPEELSAKIPVQEDWFFVLKNHDQGRRILFPMTITPKLKMEGSRRTVRQGQVVLKPKFPVEYWQFKMAIVACNAENLTCHYHS